MNYPSLYTIIVTWNKKELLISTLDDLLNQSYPNNKIIIVDNNSTDTTEEAIDEFLKDKDIKYIKNEDNYGWAKGNNIGIEIALQEGAEYVLLCNNDVIIEDVNIISDLISGLINNKGSASIISPIIKSFANKNHVQFKGISIFDNHEKIKLNKFIKNTIVLSDRYKYSDSAAGAFMLINSNVFKTIGLFDSKFFMYGEETDFCYRAWQKNIHTIVDLKKCLFHIGGASSGGDNNSFILYYKTRNLLYFLFKHYKFINRPNFFLYSYFKQKLKTIIRIIFNRYKSNDSRTKLILVLLYGILDALLGRHNRRY